ncbi:hypothetical protein I5M27_11980 [Adhaeribacter sp. BT258]|uniref:Lipoprotein n=1 Tax=Adhaeribacter terrigena TaxID=2793070 RepID=A0ABS1C2Y3_9BACT|nr:hypothetical protein [Adhaeribacter terrigena]MBK0403709.1 hypothetical protein [Adhaeribacter terrigena]
MKNLRLFLVFFGLAFYFSSCDALEKTDRVRSEVITEVKGKNLVYEMWLTGTEKFHYKFMLAGPQDTTQLFEAKFQDPTASEAIMEIEQTNSGLKIVLDKQIEKQTKTVDGVTYELEGKK